MLADGAAVAPHLQGADALMQDRTCSMGSGLTATVTGFIPRAGGREHRADAISAELSACRQGWTVTTESRGWRMKTVLATRGIEPDADFLPIIAGCR